MTVKVYCWGKLLYFLSIPSNLVKCCLLYTSCLSESDEAEEVQFHQYLWIGNRNGIGITDANPVSYTHLKIFSLIACTENHGKWRQFSYEMHLFFAYSFIVDMYSIVQAEIINELDDKRCV